MLIAIVISIAIAIAIASASASASASAIVWYLLLMLEAAKNKDSAHILDDKVVPEHQSRRKKILPSKVAKKEQSRDSNPDPSHTKLLFYDWTTRF